MSKPEVLVQARQAGKTTAAVKYAIENQYEMLAMNHSEKERLLRTYPELKPDQVFTWEEIAQRKGYKHYYGTVVDNADWILSRFLPSRLRMLTITDYTESDEGL